VADTSQRWVKSDDECDATIASSNSVNPGFRRIFVIFVALASIFLSCGKDSDAMMPFVSLAIPLVFMIVIGILGAVGRWDPAASLDNPEQIIIAYVKGANEIGPIGGFRIFILAACLVASIFFAFKEKYLEAGGLLAGILLVQPILIGLIYANECLYKEADKEQSDNGSLSCKLAKYGGLRTYLAIIWLCICAVIIKKLQMANATKAVLVTVLIFMMGILSTTASLL